MGTLEGNNKNQKRGNDGRFTRFACDVCKDEGSLGCSTCRGLGIGVNGPIEKSKCSACGGSGAVPCECQGEPEGCLV